MADIVYTYRGKVYLNITNRCPCRCTFCIRSNGDGLGSAHTLWHKSDPTAEEIAKAIEEFDFSDFPEVTFCGYGEPLCAFDNLVIAGRLLKSKYPDIKIRINTNGLGNLINKKDTVPCISNILSATRTTPCFPVIHRTRSYLSYNERRCLRFSSLSLLPKTLFPYFQDHAGFCSSAAFISSSHLGSVPREIPAASSFSR